jgi:hypothetical protein
MYVALRRSRKADPRSTEPNSERGVPYWPLPTQADHRPLSAVWRKDARGSYAKLPVRPPQDTEGDVAPLPSTIHFDELGVWGWIGLFGEWGRRGES